MKPTRHILLTIAMLLCSITANAHDFEVDGIYYDITSSTTVEVTFRGDNYNSYSNEYSGAVFIPSTVTYNSITYNVTGIGEWAFYYCSSLTEITISEGVTSIGNSAFQSCSSLTAITIPASVTSIGDDAFSWCRSLTAITIPESVTRIGKWAFSGCEGLADVKVHIASVESWFANNLANSIGLSYSLYLAGELLTKVEIPSSVNALPNHAFYNCNSLTAITIPESVTSIGSYAFINCTKVRLLS